MDTKTFSYNNGRVILQNKKVFNDIQALIQKADIDSKSGKDFSKYFRDNLEERGWEFNKKVVPGLGIRYGFRKEGIQIETQFGNMARFYSDIFKLQLGFNKGDIDAGVLIVLTKRHAHQIGSNIAHYERAKRELMESRPLYSAPIWLVGIKMPI